MISSGYAFLEKLFVRISRLNHLSAITQWDEAVNMPTGGGLARARAITEIHGIKNELLNNPDLAKHFYQAEHEENLNTWQQANVREMKRVWQQAVAIPTELLTELSMATLETEQAWRNLRKENNWLEFKPLLEKVVKLSRERANYLSEIYSCNPYEALMRLYETDFTQQDIDHYFSVLKQEIPPLLEKITSKQQSEPLIPIQGTFNTDVQRELCKNAMQQLGFDFNHGRLDETHHPFCGGVPQDTRICTRFFEHDFTEAIMATIHETGHGSYEQGLPEEWLEQPVGRSRGMAIHESQSLLFEMQVARSKPFLTYLHPQIQKYFTNGCTSHEALSLDNLLRAYHHVEPGFIRTSADEITYPLHIILRYEIERDLIMGDMQVEDIPERWDNGMQQMLGLTTKDNYKNGCMQDVHWAGGAFGYFPFYTLGAMLAAQLMDTIRKTNSDIDTRFSQGDISIVSEWLKQRIWQKGSFYTSKPLIEEATGSPLKTSAYLRHLNQRYLEDS